MREITHLFVSASTLAHRRHFSPHFVPTDSYSPTRILILPQIPRIYTDFLFHGFSSPWILSAELRRNLYGRLAQCVFIPQISRIYTDFLSQGFSSPWILSAELIRNLYGRLAQCGFIPQIPRIYTDLSCPASRNPSLPTRHYIVCATATYKLRQPSVYVPYKFCGQYQRKEKSVEIRGREKICGICGRKRICGREKKTVGGEKKEKAGFTADSSALYTITL